jgi:hypothetical protein
MKVRCLLGAFVYLLAMGPVAPARAGSSQSAPPWLTRHGSPTTARSIYGRWLAEHFRMPARLAGSGALPASSAGLAIAQLEVSSDTAAGHYRQTEPVAAAFTTGQQLVFWLDEKNGVPEIFARAFDRALTPRGAQFELFTDGLNRRPEQLTCVSDGRMSVLSWLNQNPYAIRTAFVDSQGLVLEEQTAGNVSSAPFLASPAGAAWSADTFLTVWEEFRLGWRIIGQAYDSAGTPLGVNHLLDGTADTLLKTSPAVAADTAGGFLVAWTQGDASRSDVYVRHFDSLNDSQSSAIVITAPAAGESYLLPKVVYSTASHRYLVVYVRADLPFDSTSLWVRSVSPTGAISDSAVALPAGPYPWAPFVARSAGRTVVFTARFDNLSEIRSLSISDSGSVVDGSEVISTAAVRERAGASSSTGGDTLTVVWQDRVSGEFDIHGLTRSGGQTVASEATLQSEGPGGQQTQSDASVRLGGGVHVVYADLQAGGDIAMVDVSEAGAIVQRQRVSDESLLAPQYDPHIASTSTGWSLITWTDERTDWSGPAVHAAGRFAQAGVFAAASFPLASSSAAVLQSQTDVAMRSDKNSAVVWIDDRSGSPRAYLRRFDGTGSPQGAEVTLADGSLSQLVIALEQDPVVAMDSTGILWTAWSAFDIISDSFFVLAQAWSGAGVRKGHNVVLGPAGPAPEPQAFDAAIVGGGRLRLVWFDTWSPSPAVKTAVFDSTGAVLEGPGAISAAPIVAHDPRVAVDASGRWAAAWSQSSGSSEDIVWQRFEVDGTPTAPVERISGSSPAVRRAPALAYSGAYLYGAWHGNEVAGKGFDVRLSSLLKASADVRDGESVLPDGITLHANYPNPFNGSTLIGYSLDRPAEVRLDIFDALGRHVKTLADRVDAPGVHELLWDGRDERGRSVGSGVYLCRLVSGSHATARKMLYLK